MSINVLLGSIGSCSDCAGPAYTPDKALDGDPNTFYSSSALSGSWVEFDMTVRKNIYYCSLTPVNGFADRVNNVAILVDGTQIGVTNVNGDFPLAAALAGRRIRFQAAGNALSFVAATAWGDLIVPSSRPPINVVFDGNSLTAGNGGTQPYTARCVQGLQLAGYDVNSHNLGVGGQTTAQMIARAAAVVDTLIDPTRQNIYVGWEGINDLYFGATAQQAYDNLVALYQGRRAAGFKVVAVTLTPRANPGTPAGYEAARLQVNDWVRQHWRTFADAVADNGSTSPVGSASCLTDTFWYPDLVHHTDNGYTLDAGVIGNAVMSTQP
jgi:lysophospholipase L1-like esterase